MLKQKNEKKDKRRNKWIGKNKSSHVKMIVIAPKKIKIICLFFLKSRENVPKIMIAVKMTSLANTRWEDKSGKKRMIINRQIRRIMLFLVKCFGVIMNNNVNR